MYQGTTLYIWTSQRPLAKSVSWFSWSTTNRWILACHCWWVLSASSGRNSPKYFCWLCDSSHWPSFCYAWFPRDCQNRQWSALPKWPMGKVHENLRIQTPPNHTKMAPSQRSRWVIQQVSHESNSCCTSAIAKLATGTNNFSPHSQEYTTHFNIVHSIQTHVWQRPKNQNPWPCRSKTSHSVPRAVLWQHSTPTSGWWSKKEDEGIQRHKKSCYTQWHQN